MPSRPWITHPSLGPLTDIPVERPSIGGAGAPTMGSRYPSNELLFRRYTYRGTGEDIYEVKVYEVKPKPKPKPKRRPRPPAKPKPPPLTPEQRAEIRERATEKAKATVARKKAARLAWVAEQKRLRGEVQPRPSRGWTPTKGDDIEDLLKELEDDPDV